MNTPRLQHLSLSILLLSGAANAQFHDDFVGSKLDPAWTWSDPGNDCSYQLGSPPGRLRMIVPPGNDHTTGHAAPLYAGPMLTVPTTGDFTITTHVTVNYPTAPAAMESGLIIWQDSSNNLQFTRTNAYNSQNVLYYGNIANATTTFHGNVVLSANELYLRIQRSGSSFTSSYSTDGLAWTKAGSVNWNVTGTVNVGIATSFWLWFGTTNNPANGDYMFFDLAVPTASLQADRAGISVAAGGTIGLSLNLGNTRAGQSYLLVGSITGSRPGLIIPGGQRLPLNWDVLSDIMLANANLPGFFPGTAGTLDASGKASAQVIVPKAAAVPLTGVSFIFAGVSYPSVTAPLHPTNAVGVAIAR
jgi:Beta xylosidase C-terminal Concanavalin A-like domain